jgi:hypothetical protein
MTTTTDQRRAAGDAINALCAHLQQYASFTIGRVHIDADAGYFTIEIVDRFGWVDAANMAAQNGDEPPDWDDYTYEARASSLDEAFIIMAHYLAGTAEAPF